MIFLQRATSAVSKELILQRVTSDFTTSNEERVNFNKQRERVKSYASSVIISRSLKESIKTGTF